MTRDDAIEVYAAAAWPDAPFDEVKGQARRAVDALAKLGLLKLEEPPAEAYAYTAWALRRKGFHLHGPTLKSVLDEIGLTIVEKDSK